MEFYELSWMLMVSMIFRRGEIELEKLLLEYSSFTLVYTDMLKFIVVYTQPIEQTDIIIATHGVTK